MTNRWAGILIGLTVVLGVVSSAQTGRKPAGAAWSPRMPWGHPNLQGVWDRHSITPVERPKVFEGREFLTEDEARELEGGQKTTRGRDIRGPANSEEDVTGAYNEFWWDRATSVVQTRRTSQIIDPKNGRLPPLTPRGQEEARREPHLPAMRSLGSGGRGSDSWFDRSLWERCVTQGTPRLAAIAYNANFQIFQSQDTVAILHEQIHEARIIPLDGRPHVGQGLRLWMGDSRGRWEGDTLVVDTTNFTDKTNFRGSTDNLHMVERFRRIDESTLDYTMTFEDPTIWTAPWTVHLPMPRTKGIMYEYACHEGNHAMHNILSGARVQERKKHQAAEAVGKQPPH